MIMDGSVLSESLERPINLVRVHNGISKLFGNL